MRELEPCPACRRHVAVREARCPMCGVELAIGWARSRAAVALPRGLGRTARLIALGITVSACGARTDLDGEHTGAPVDAATPSGDAGRDASTVRDASTARDAGQDAGDIPIPLYGAAPMPGPGDEDG